MIKIPRTGYLSNNLSQTLTQESVSGPPQTRLLSSQPTECHNETDRAADCPLKPLLIGNPIVPRNSIQIVPFAQLQYQSERILVRLSPGGQARSQRASHKRPPRSRYREFNACCIPRSRSSTAHSSARTPRRKKRGKAFGHARQNGTGHVSEEPTLSARARRWL